MKMKWLMVVAALLGLGVMMSGCQCWCKCGKASAEVKKLTTPEMLAAVADTNVTVVDARGAHDGMAMIPRAIPLSYEASDAVIATTLKDKNASIVTYCANTHCTASPQLAARLVKLGYTHVSEYPEGIAGWQKAHNQ